MLLYFGIVPYVVFDGDSLPSKAATEEARAAKRESCRKTGLALLDNGRRAEAYRELQGAIDVTPQMARLFIEELRKLNIQYVVAPYEADAQLVYLESHGLIDGIISEDSDMLVFGAKRLISKLDRHGDCIELNRDDFAACKEVSLVGWTDADFRLMCILSGCDYLQNIPGMGLKTAYRYVRKHKTVERIVQMLRFENKTTIPPTYLDNFRRAEFTFLYQRIYCPNAQKLATLRPIPVSVDIEQLTYIGDDMKPEIAKGVAVGDLHPTTKEPLGLPQPPLSPKNLQSHRRWTESSDDCLKPSPITAFFTPKRVPLATLDSNVLTPSRSQEDLLRRNADRSWSANAVVANARSLRTSQSTTSASPLGLRRSTSSNSSSIGKRLREFSDSPGRESDIETPSKSTLETKSRYFANVKPAHKSKEKDNDCGLKKSKVSLPTSDTQISDLPHILVPPINPTDQKVHCRPALEKDHQLAVTGKRNAASPVISNVASEESSSLAEQRSGVNDDMSTADIDALQHHFDSQNLKLHEKYSYSAPVNTRDLQGEKALIEKVRSDDTSAARDPLPPRTYRPISRTVSANSTTGRTTPLERLKRMALARSRSLNSLKLGSKPVVASQPPPEKKTILTENIIHRGSEDMIAPGSEDDEDCSSPERIERKEKKKTLFNLDEFMFVPKAD